jgi:hypothetical protein
MQEEYEQECREHAESIAELERILKARGAHNAVLAEKLLFTKVS